MSKKTLIVVDMQNDFWIDDDRGNGVIEEMKRKAREVLKRYQ